MIFYRRPGGPGPARLNVRLVRVLSTAALVLYPVGAIIRLVGHREMVFDIVGFALIFLALAAFAGIVGSRLQRITSEQACRLDEMEISLRQTVQAWAYRIFGAIAILSVFYMRMAADIQGQLTLWVPQTEEQWNAIMWGAMLMVFVLPTALLAWKLPVEEIDPE